MKQNSAKFLTVTMILKIKSKYLIKEQKNENFNNRMFYFQFLYENCLFKEKRITNINLLKNFS